MLTLYVIILGILEGIVVYRGAFVILIDAIPFIITIFSKKLFKLR
ncbi:hypothetical protein [Sulfolobus sp. E11-6]|nr:hypothetical protein [Sulfolobus sp. E11-6]